MSFNATTLCCPCGRSHISIIEEAHQHLKQPRKFKKILFEETLLKNDEKNNVCVKDHHIINAVFFLPRTTIKNKQF